MVIAQLSRYFDGLDESHMGYYLTQRDVISAFDEFWTSRLYNVSARLDRRMHSFETRAIGGGTT